MSRLAAPIAVLLLALTGCMQQPPGQHYSIPEPDSMVVWAAGDSISVGYAPHYPGAIGIEAVSGSSFVAHPTVNTIGDVIDGVIGAWGLPEQIILMGGTNDGFYGVPVAAVEARIVELTERWESYGIVVHHVAEPSWGTRRPYVETLNAWLMATYPATVDCATPFLDISWTHDGVHPAESSPSGMSALAHCIYDGLHP